MSSYHGWTHAPKAQGGTDPIPGGAGEIPWIRLKQLDLHQTWSDNDSRVVIYDNVVNPYPTYFEVDDIIDPGDNAVVHPLIAGLLQVTFRAFCDITPTPFPPAGFEININGVDWDKFAYYSQFVPGPNTVVDPGVPINTGGAGYSEVTFRMDVLDAFADPPSIYVHIETFADPMVLQDNGGGTYMEVRYLGAATAPLGLDNQNPE